MDKFFKINHPIVAILLCGAIAISVFFSLTLLAKDHNNALDLVKAGEIMPLATILNKLEKLEQGQIIEVELEKKKKRLIYEIELVNKQGVVKKYIFDAKSGVLIKEKTKD
tara:strand:- start:1994 stop:2323 length:330 start_codon:yes stop_codon:yes gene_type:complete